MFVICDSLNLGLLSFKSTLWSAALNQIVFLVVVSQFLHKFVNTEAAFDINQDGPKLLSLID